MIAKQSSRIGFKRLTLTRNASIPFILNTMTANADPRNVLAKIIIDKVETLFVKDFFPCFLRGITSNSSFVNLVEQMI